ASSRIASRLPSRLATGERGGRVLRSFRNSVTPGMVIGGEVTELEIVSVPKLVPIPVPFAVPLPVPIGNGDVCVSCWCICFSHNDFGVPGLSFGKLIPPPATLCVCVGGGLARSARSVPPIARSLQTTVPAT